MYQWQIIGLIDRFSLGVYKGGQEVSPPVKHNWQSALIKSSVLQT